MRLDASILLATLALSSNVSGMLIIPHELPPLHAVSSADAVVNPGSKPAEVTPVSAPPLKVDDGPASEPPPKLEDAALVSPSTQSSDAYPRQDPVRMMEEPGASWRASRVSADGAHTSENLFFKTYQPLSVIEPWMRLMASMFSSHVRLITIGSSYESREILALKVGVHPTNDNAPSPPRKTILINGGTHAREWISTAAVLYTAWEMITGYGKNGAITKLVHEFDWVFLPTLNPDGYVYSWEHDRLWRKNRQNTTSEFCKGIDIDRSFGYQWSDAGAFDNTCSESYPGAQEWEAVEAAALRTWTTNETEHNNVKFVGYLDLHSYSQQILYPFSYSCDEVPASLENLEELAIGLAKSIRLSSGMTYAVGSACESGMVVPSLPVVDLDAEAEAERRIEGPSEPAFSNRQGSSEGSGAALDWFYKVLGVRSSFQIKLRDTGAYGFLLPGSEIVPTGEEAFAALRYFGDWLLSNKGIEHGGSEGVAKGFGRKGREGATRQKDVKEVLVKVDGEAVERGEDL
jgi:extracellular matrix protein 14